MRTAAPIALAMDGGGRWGTLAEGLRRSPGQPISHRMATAITCTGSEHGVPGVGEDLKTPNASLDGPTMKTCAFSPASIMRPMLDCRTLARLLSQSQDGAPPLAIRARMRLHLMTRQACHNVDQQMRFA
jgi:hypothetical protein